MVTAVIWLIITENCLFLFLSAFKATLCSNKTFDHTGVYCFIDNRMLMGWGAHIFEYQFVLLDVHFVASHAGVWHVSCFVKCSEVVSLHRVPLKQRKV